VFVVSRKVYVVSKDGQLLHPCSREKADALVAKGHAERIDDEVIVLIMTRHEKARIRKAVLRRDGYTCYYCGKKLDDETATVDHIIPRSKLGSSFASNLVCSCQECNLKKGNRMPESTILPKGDADID
jgi:5-methylcytosine-specific restriction endonuclease McrA